MSGVVLQNDKVIVLPIGYAGGGKVGVGIEFCQPSNCELPAVVSQVQFCRPGYRGGYWGRASCSVEFDGIIHCETQTPLGLIGPFTLGGGPTSWSGSAGDFTARLEIVDVTPEAWPIFLLQLENLGVPVFYAAGSTPYHVWPNDQPLELHNIWQCMGEPPYQEPYGHGTATIWMP